MTNLASLLDCASVHPERTAIVFGDATLTYGQLDSAASQVANLLASRGVAPGDKVALSCPNLPYFTIVYYGILKAGAVVVPLNVLLKPREIAYHLDDCDAVAYFAFEGSRDLPIGENARRGFDAVAACLDLFVIHADPTKSLPWHDQSTHFETVIADDDTAVILYTSGTTGQPKGAELRHSNMLSNALASVDMLALDRSVPDTFLCALPLFHAFGQTCMQNAGLAAGATLVLLPRFEPHTALRLLLRHQVTVFGGVPTMYWALLRALDETVDVATIAANLRVACSGGSALPGEVHKSFHERFGIAILEGYGLSETSPVASFSRYGEEPRVGSIGRPIPHVEMKLINEDWSDLPDDNAAIGEIAIKGPNVMKGYYNRPEATAAAIRDGWFRSGDLARRDADGYYYIVDRTKDMIIRGGFNVYPREIEEVLITHPAVSLVAVVGVPHESHGEEIKAVVVKERNHDDVTEADLVAWAKTQIAAYKYPRIVQFADELPMSSTGKILKRDLA